MSKIQPYHIRLFASFIVVYYLFLQKNNCFLKAVRTRAIAEKVIYPRLLPNQSILLVPVCVLRVL